MLTADLLRARVVKGEVRPRYVDARRRRTCSARGRDRVETFPGAPGQAPRRPRRRPRELTGEGPTTSCTAASPSCSDDRSDLRGARPRRAAGPAPGGLRGLRAGAPRGAHRRRAAPRDPRRRAGRRWPPSSAWRSPRWSSGMYADLEDEQVMTAARARGRGWCSATTCARAGGAACGRGSWSPREGDPARYRQLFRWVKFYRLMHTVRGARRRGGCSPSTVR
jgi:hypothetical protein